MQFWDTHNKQLFVIYLKLKFSWASFILCGKSTWDGVVGDIRVFWIVKKAHNYYCIYSAYEIQTLEGRRFKTLYPIRYFESILLYS